ncbi:MAG: Hsp20/alpha crystallin family protein, partial [Flavobacteriales bacterium]
DLNQIKSTTGGAIPVNIAENPKAYIIEVSAPGRNKENFKIDCESDVLTLSWSKEKRSDSDSKDQYRRKEFELNSFKRDFKLPKNIERKDIYASYENGILVVGIPKSIEAQKEEKLEIKIA